MILVSNHFPRCQSKWVKMKISTADLNPSLFWYINCGKSFPSGWSSVIIMVWNPEQSRTSWRGTEKQGSPLGPVWERQKERGKGRQKERQSERKTERKTDRNAEIKIARMRYRMAARKLMSLCPCLWSRKFSKQLHLLVTNQDGNPRGTFCPYGLQLLPLSAQVQNFLGTVNKWAKNPSGSHKIANVSLQDRVLCFWGLRSTTSQSSICIQTESDAGKWSWALITAWGEILKQAFPAYSWLENLEYKRQCGGGLAGQMMSMVGWCSLCTHWVHPDQGWL